MIQKCRYCKGADIMAVVPGLGVNVNNALSSGIIKDTCSETMFNQQKSLSEVGSRVAEPFDIVEYDRAYARARKAVLDAEKDKSDE